MKGSPVIITGMHRAGTTLLSEIIQEFGFYLGRNKDENNEPIYLIGLNDWILESCGARWDSPKSVKPILDNEQLTELVVDYLKHSLSGIKSYKYWFGSRQDELWGWKDPRNTFTLDLWLKLFPEAKVINITREPMDVANSLYVRSNKALVSSYNNKFKIKLENNIYTKKGMYTDSVKCLNINECISIWLEYTKKSYDNERLVTNGNYLSIKYEDLLSDKETLESIANFLQIDVDKNQFISIRDNFKPERLNAYKRNEELIKVRDNYKKEFEKLGY